MNLDLRDLELLDGLASGGTMTAAAGLLYVSQPALSQRLTKMEERLGVQLFEREGRRLVPTDAGRRMLIASRHVLAELRSAVRDVHDIRDGRDKSVRFAAQCSTTFQWLSPVLRVFRDLHPEAEVRIQSVPRDEPIAALLDNIIDVALITKPDRQMDRVALMPVFEDEMVAVVSAQHPWAHRDHLTAADFDGVHLILYDSYDQTRIPAPALPIPHGARPASVTTMPVITDLVIEMVASGEGVSVLPNWVAAPYVPTRGVSAVRIGEQPSTRTWYAATRHGEQRSRITDFIKALSSVLATSSPL